MITFSIIIPFHNSEATIERCLISLNKQTFDSFEVLLIDNNSCDKTREICDEFSKQDSRFKVLNCKKQGPGFARNVGLDNVKNDYIIFIDADDYIDLDYLSKLSEIASKENPDVIFVGYYLDNDRFQNILQNKNDFDEKFNKYEKGNLIIKLLKHDCFGFSCCKVFKKELITNNIRFDTKYSLHEDTIFTCALIDKMGRSVFSAICSYHYIKYKETLTSLFRSDIIENLDYSNNYYFQLIDKYGNSDINQEKIKRSAFLLFLIFKNYFKSSKKKISKEECYKILNSNFVKFAFKKKKALLKYVAGKIKFSLFFIALFKTRTSVSLSYKVFYLIHKNKKNDI